MRYRAVRSGTSSAPTVPARYPPGPNGSQPQDLVQENLTPHPSAGQKQDERAPRHTSNTTGLCELNRTSAKSPHLMPQQPLTAVGTCPPPPNRFPHEQTPCPPNGATRQSHRYQGESPLGFALPVPGFRFLAHVSASWGNVEKREKQFNLRPFMFFPAGECALGDNNNAHRLARQSPSLPPTQASLFPRWALIHK